jgi:hypothetical protein
MIKIYEQMADRYDTFRTEERMDSMIITAKEIIECGLTEEDFFLPANKRQDG